MKKYCESIWLILFMLELYQVLIEGQFNLFSTWLLLLLFILSSLIVVESI